MEVKKAAQFTGHNAAVFALAVGANGQFFFSGAGDAWVVRWDIGQPEMGKLVARVEAQVFSLCVLEAAQKIVAGNMNGGLHWIDLAEPSNTKNFAHHQGGVFDVKAIGGWVFSIGGDGKITRWSVREMRPTESYLLANQSLRCMTFSIERGELALGGSDGCIYFLDAATLEIRHVIRQAHGSSVFSLAYSPDQKRLLSGGRDAHLNSWDLGENYRKISAQPAHWFTINSIVYSPDGKYFATASRDKTLKIWDSTNLELLKVLEGGRDGGHFNSVNKLLWLPGGLLSCSDDRTMILWEVTA